MVACHRIRNLFFHTILIIPLVTALPPAKTRHIEGMPAAVAQKFSLTSVSSLEHRLTPFFENRKIHRQAGSAVVKKTIPPNESDLMMLSKAWRLLSPQFKELYRDATSLPDSSKRHATPGGHFEIYYFTSGRDSVDPADVYGFDLSNWRERVALPNGIPDYIDETAFALDSCWSMEIDRFGFLPPDAFVDQNHRSDRYKVVVEQQENSFYGLTYLQNNPEGVHGFLSTMSLRNNWGDDWSDLGYDRNPVNGTRVTCAHEFFHAIQYWMSWEVENIVELDYFPLSWTEGAAVSMEELAFDSINDYFQYAPAYFSDPGMSFFDPNTSDYTMYTNALLVLYLNKFFPPGNNIEFTRTIFFTNYAKKTPFHENLWGTAKAGGKSWVGLLHDFHIGSFFTGSNADTSRFLSDAAKFRMHTPPSLPQTRTVFRNVGLNSAALIRLLPADFPQDTLFILLNGETPPLAGKTIGSGWACSIKLKKNNENTFLNVPIDSNCTGTASIPAWPSFDEAVIVITNGDPLVSRQFQIHLSGDTLQKSQDPVVFPNPVSINRNLGTVHFRGDNLSMVSVRSFNGLQLWSSRIDGKSTKEVTWNCKTASGKRISPGTYLVLLTQDGGSTGPLNHLRQKLLVIP